MASVLDQLSSNEAILLMYLANELPHEDRTAIEARLNQDAVLRGQLEQIRLAYASMDKALGLADAATPLPSTFSAARSFGEAIRLAHRKKPSQDETLDKPRRRLYLMLFPAAAAAMLALGMLVWWQIANKAEIAVRDGVQMAQEGDEDKSDANEMDPTDPGYWLPLDLTRPVPGTVADLNDDELVATFDSVIVDRDLPSQSEYNVITYLNESLQ